MPLAGMDEYVHVFLHDGGPSGACCRRLYQWNAGLCTDGCSTRKRRI